MSIATKCRNGKHGRNKRIAYGEQRSMHYCTCDVEVSNKVNKKSERQKAKKEIQKVLKNGK